MSKIKLCGLRRIEDIEYANTLAIDYIGFIFAKSSKRYVNPEQAEILRKRLNTGITPVGVFVDEEVERIVDLIGRNIIAAVQLHGNEDEEYIATLRKRTDCPIIKAFRVKSKADIEAANHFAADYVLLDSGSGSGESFDWSLIKEMKKRYFLAGGLTCENVGTAIAELHPFAVDASSSLETDGFKDKEKMAAFVNAVRQGKD